MQQRITINLNTDSKTTDKTTILEYCRSHGIAGIETPCGGKGTCGKCKVTVTKPYYKDVLACQTKICDGMEIIVGRKESTGTKEDSMVVLTNGENVSEKFNEHVNRNVEDTLAACDIGLIKRPGRLSQPEAVPIHSAALEQMYFPELMRQRGRMITIKRMAACR